MKLPDGTPFQQQVWRALLSIPRGQIRTYAEIAHQIGAPNAARAVANACGANPLPIVVPCHRVVASDGSIGGYSGRGGVKRKISLLEKEGVIL
jgi:O-6-methylguanine DNA methyltransferase